MVDKTRSAISKLLLPLVITVSAVFSLSWNAPLTERASEATRTEVAAHFTSPRCIAFHQPKSFIACVDRSGDYFYQSLLYQKLIAISLDQQLNVTQILQKPLAFKVFKLLPSEEGDIYLA